MVGFIEHKVIIQFWITMSATLVLTKWLSTASSQKPTPSQHMYLMGTYLFLLDNGVKPKSKRRRIFKLLIKMVLNF